MTQVILYSSDEAGAPALTTAAGALIGVLDACLVDGFNAKSVLALTVTSHVAVAQISAHGYKTGRFVTFAGADTPAVNGSKRVTVVDSNHVSFTVPTVADGAVTGTITTKRTPLGWSKPLAGTNVAVYAPTDVDATVGMLRLDDTSANSARVVGYEAMTDVDTGTGPFPTPTQMGGGLYWFKADNNNPTSSRNWFVIGDGKRFYLAIAPAGNASFGAAFDIWGFGTLNAYRVGDDYSTFITGSVNAPTSTGSVNWYCCGASTKANVSSWHPRRHTGFGSAQAAYRIGMGHINTADNLYSGTGGYGFGTYPNSPDYGLLLTRVACVPSVHDSYRGEYPGILHGLQEQTGTFAPGDIVPGTGEFAGRDLMAVTLGLGYNNNIPSYLNAAFFDLTGPW